MAPPMAKRTSRRIDIAAKGAMVLRAAPIPAAAMRPAFMATVDAFTVPAVVFVAAAAVFWAAAFLPAAVAAPVDAPSTLNSSLTRAW